MRLFKRKFILFIFLISCGFNAFPVSDDINLGKQVIQEINNNPNEYPILKDPGATNYLQGIINQLLRAPQIKYKDRFAYKVTIVNRDDIINAFCTPGGYIYVYTGLLKSLKDEATLAGILGHEIAHAERRHSTNRMTKAYGVSLLSGIILGNNPSDEAKIGANLFTGLALLKNSRNDELEADEDSFKYLLSTKIWYPGGIKSFFENASGTSGGKLLEWFSTHPMPKNRIDNINELLKENNVKAPNATTLRTKEYQEFRNKYKM